MPLYLGNNIISEKINTGDVYIENTFDLFDTKWSDHTINNPSWIRSDTFEWVDGTIFTSAWTELNNEFTLAIVDSTPPETDEIDGISIPYWRTPKGYKVVNYGGDTPEENETLLQQLYEKTGVAWYYLIDTTGQQRFKLPRTKYHFEGLRTGSGNFISESLPNITGSFQAHTGEIGVFLADGNKYEPTGAFSGIQNKTAASLSASTSTDRAGMITFDASRLSSVYQNEADVQEKSTEMYLYFYITDSLRTPLQENLNTFITETKEQLALKVNTSTFDEKTLEIETSITSLTNSTSEQLNLKANIESPALTGTPTCPTPAVNNNSTTMINSAWFNSKIQVVSALPQTPATDVFYFVTG